MLRNNQKSVGLSPHIFLTVGGTHNPKIQSRPCVEQDPVTDSNFIISFSENGSWQVGLFLGHKEATQTLLSYNFLPVICLGLGKRRIKVF